MNTLRNEMVHYLVSMSEELAKIADQQGLETLVYLFAMAHHEAKSLQPQVPVREAA